MPAATLTKSSPDKAFVTAFGKNPALAFLAIIEQAPAPLRAADIKAAAISAGIPKSTVDEKWRPAQLLIKTHPWVRLDGQRYVWRTEPVAAVNVLPLLVSKALPQWLRDAFGAVVAAELGAASAGRSDAAGPAGAPEPATTKQAQTGTSAEPAQPAAVANTGVDPAIRAAQERQWKIDVVRAVAELAIEAEEIAFKGADAELILERLQTRAALHSLQPIGQAGGQVAFDPAQHEPLAGDPAVGSAVFVVRPGYTWHARNEDVLIERAVVSTT